MQKMPPSRFVAVSHRRQDVVRLDGLLRCCRNKEKTFFEKGNARHPLEFPVNGLVARLQPEASLLRNIRSDVEATVNAPRPLNTRRHLAELF